MKENYKMKNNYESWVNGYFDEDEGKDKEITKHNELPNTKIAPMKFNLLMDECSCPLWANKEGYIQKIESINTKDLSDIKTLLDKKKLKIGNIEKELKQRDIKSKLGADPGPTKKARYTLNI